MPWEGDPSLWASVVRGGQQGTHRGPSGSYRQTMLFPSGRIREELNLQPRKGQ